MLSLHVRPRNVRDHHIDAHFEGDVFKGEGNANAVGTLLERTI